MESITYQSFSEDKKIAKSFAMCVEFPKIVVSFYFVNWIRKNK